MQPVGKNCSAEIIVRAYTCKYVFIYRYLKIKITFLKRNCEKFFFIVPKICGKFGGIGCF